MKATKRKVLTTYYQWHKYNYIKTFFLLNEKVVMDIYKRSNGSLVLTPENWKKFINSRELFGSIYIFISNVSDFTLNAIMNSEPFEELGVEILTDSGKIYYAAPEKFCYSTEYLTIEYAVVCFIVTLAHFMFKKMCNENFIIKKGLMLVSLDENLEYVLI